jgi:hypothetical protein
MVRAGNGRCFEIFLNRSFSIKTNRNCIEKFSVGKYWTHYFLAGLIFWVLLYHLSSGSPAFYSSCYLVALIISLTKVSSLSFNFFNTNNLGYLFSKDLTSSILYILSLTILVLLSLNLSLGVGHKSSFGFAENISSYSFKVYLQNNVNGWRVSLRYLLIIINNVRVHFI